VALSAASSPHASARPSRTSSTSRIRNWPGLRTIEVRRANVEDLTDKGANFALVVRGKTRDRLVYLRPDTRARMQEYVALGGETARDRDGTPLFSTIDSPRHRLTRTRIRAIIGIRQSNHIFPSGTCV
jgi:integrase